MVELMRHSRGSAVESSPVAVLPGRFLRQTRVAELLPKKGLSRRPPAVLRLPAQFLRGRRHVAQTAAARGVGKKLGPQKFFSLTESNFVLGQY